MNRKIVLFLFAIGCFFSINAQLSDLHYLPPLKQGQNNAGIREQAIHLSTPEPTTFAVNVYRGTGATPVATFNISNVSPAVYSLSNGDNNIILVNNANTGVVLNNSGLRFESPSGNRFYVNYRGSSSAQSASLTSKGRVAMGTQFKWGGVPNLGAHPSKSNTLGIMATEDNTTIDVFGYDPGCEFRVGNNRAGITADTYQITLNANESFVFETYIGNSPTPAHQDGWIGASIVSDKDIVISNGSINFGRQAGASNRDAGIDQPVPENRLGKEYVFVRGNGNTNGSTEFPLIIATSDNTQIFVNGAATPIATLNNGDYFEVPSSFYSANTVGANMLVQTSKDVYAYQCMAGASQVYTQGLNFVAPVNCLLPDVMDNIPDIRNMAGTVVSGGLTIIAAVNTPDANISVTDGNGAVTLPASNPVAGSTDWKTFYIPNLNGNVSVQSTGPMAIGFFGYNGARGVAGYFSGFDTVPEVTLEIRGGTGCFVGSTIFEATGNFDAYQWYGDGQLIPGANAPSYAPNIAGDYFVRGTKGPCTYDSQAIQALYCDPDIVINKTVDNPEIMEGETATFNIRVRNLGVGPLTNFQLTDNIPTGLTLVNSFTINGSWSGNTWNIGTLNGGETAELELEVRADEIDTLPLLSLTNVVTHTQDQTDANITQDNPIARITVHNDYDNDGVRDITDLDDDNDGVYDEDECENLTFNISGGNAHNSALISVENYLILDIFSLDNSFNLQINGTDIAGEIQFQNAPGNFARFLDGTGYGESGNPQIYSLSGSDGSPLLRVVIDQAGQFELFGARSSNGPLEPMLLTTPPGNFTWNASGNNTISIDQDVVGPTNMRGILLTAGCDTDSDGIPDQLDLDSDGDGCSDANEFYKDSNADGGDGGEYGTGVPVVDATDGTVDAASYVQVFAPEILLGNTSEDLGGTDINGQGVNLGQTFDYVLRFQNTGDDNAVGYTIRNVLPENVTLVNVDTSDAGTTSYTPDAANRTLTFTIPDNLVEVGDPEYSIRITVTVAANCSEFVSACSSQLENLAYSTYQGTLNPATFTDEGGSNSITACPRTPEIASNSLLSDLSSCNQARTVQLCGADVLLSAGSGFTVYNWVLDTNGNGQADASDTVLNDGDPDGDPSTLTVTAIGNYIVEKSAGGTCPDLVERITVERFGTTQTNPIISYFNQVNGDSDTSNDIQGEIVTCSIDGDLLPKVFLCGATDEATIQLGITDADSIVWEQLDESSCGDTGDDCANKNGSCTWNSVGTGNNFTLTDSGEYRVVINYQNGCFSRFYVNVFKNELDVAYTSEDILCNTPGNIRITNVGAGYGFSLLNATDDSVIIPYSDNNGPNFNITSSGTYKVQVTQLDPSTGLPIVGSCVFETEDIGILERNFSVDLDSTPADCNNLGTVTVQALNAAPNYSYELRLDDGSNAGQGSLVSTVAATNDNTHTFPNVNPEDYIVITRTQDGCFDSQNITVNRIPQLTLVANTTDNITCSAGIVNLTPAGGQPNPQYEMAIWSKDGTPLWTDEASIPDAAFDTNTNVLFGYGGTPTAYIPNQDGDYVFIVRDGSGCYGYSNSTRVEDLGSLTISASNSTITCADSATATLTVSVTGGNAPYRYSLDGGTNYQNENTFVNLPAGLYTITVMDATGTPSTACVADFDYEIVQPFRLTASAAIIEDASCNPAGALVKIVNASGGQAPYTYSFDGGSNFSGVDAQNLLAGNYQLIVEDALGCTFDMDLTVPTPPSSPSFSEAVTYDCVGDGTITITPSNITDFTYTYALNGTANTPTDNNVFTGVADGTQTVTVGYMSSLTPSQTQLFIETFGSGPTTQIAEVGPGYCYEPQNGTTTTCNLGPAGILVDGEYTVTNFVTNPIPAYRNPNDHSALVDGRFLAINPSNNLVGSSSIIWAKRNVEVLPNRDVTITFYAYNLRQTGSAGNNPEVEVQLVDTGGAIINSTVTAEIPKNANNNDWYERTVTFNPGANTTVDIVFRSNQPSDDGNELILDDIQAYQLPEVCEQTVDITVVVQDNQEFSAALLDVTDPSCNGATDGAIRFEVSNFDPITGFEYSVDGGTNFTTSIISPVTTTANLSDGTYNVIVRRINDISCSTNFNATLTQPSLIVPTLAQTADFTCFNTGGTLEASATGGTPGYTYQIEDTSNAIIRAFQNDGTFLNVPAGTYQVRVRDLRGCEVVSASTINIAAPQVVDFDLSATACYDGSNNATITITVNGGNGDYTFSLDGGAAMTPDPLTPLTYIFNGLANGSYSIEVTDAFGCSDTDTIDILPNLTATVTIDDVSSCADGSITVSTASGGAGSFVYAFLTTGTTVQDSDFGPSNSITINNTQVGDYDVYVRDNSGTSPYCQFMQTVRIENEPALNVTATPTNAICFGDPGSIEVDITAGLAPFTYRLVDNDNGQPDQVQTGVVNTTRTYFNLLPGTYDVIITDASGCSRTVSGVAITQPDELTADIAGETPASCTGLLTDFGFKFLNYPTTVGFIQFSADGGTSWPGDNSVPGTSDVLTGYASGSTVNPSMRTVDGSGNVCQTDFPPFVIPFPLDDLDITILPIIVDCNELQVSVRGQNGSSPYMYTYTDDPANFNITTPVNGWVGPFAAGVVHDFPGLVPGRTYTFYVRDASLPAPGCVRQSSVNVNDIVTNPMEITATYQPACSGANNGEITYNITDTDGLTEPDMRWALYDIDGNTIRTSGGDITYSNTINITGLAADEYYIEVTQVDAGGSPQCISGSENLLLEQLDPISGSLRKIQDISCEDPGMIAIDNLQGGGGTYTFNVTGPLTFSTGDNPIQIPANSPGGSYTIEIVDQFGCSKPAPFDSITLDLAPNPVISTVDVNNCGTTSIVTINATSAGSALILYSIDGGTTYLNNGGIFNNVTAGSYSASVKDGNGCTDSHPFDVHQSLQAAASLTRNLGCGAGQEAIVSIEATAGSGNYSYEILDGTNVQVDTDTFTTSITATLTVVDTYTVNIYDTNTSSPQCFRTFSIEVVAPTAPDFTVTPNDVTCFGDADGTIVIAEVNNGNNPLNYTISPNVATFNATTNSFENLPDGIYEITGTGPNGCVTTRSNIPVNEPAQITFNVPAVTPFGCTSGNTTNNAIITIDTGSITGVTLADARYDFIDDSTGDVLQSGTNSDYQFTDLAGGDVIVRIVDLKGCNNEVTVTVAPFDQVTSATVTVDDDISCSNLGEDISIDVISSLTNYTANPGNYEFEQLPSGGVQASNVFTDLQPGSYTFIARNRATGCEITVNHVVEEPNTFDVTVEKLADVTCFGDDGSIRLMMSDATYVGSFSWEIFDTNGTPADRSDDGAAIETGNSPGFGPTLPIAVPAGNYLIEVTQDAFPDCSQVRSFNITTPSAPLTLGTPILTDVGCTNDQGSATITPQGGQAPYDITLTNNGTAVSANVSQVNAHTFANLTAGQYSVVVTDALGCPATFTNAFELLLPDPITGNIAATALVCQGDTDASVSISLNPRNVTSNYRYILNAFDDAVGTTLLQSSASQTLPTFLNLGAGFYRITVLDDMGCSFESAIVEIIDPVEPLGMLTTLAELTCQTDAQLELVVSGGTSPYTWSSDGTTFNAMNGINGPNTHVFQNVTDGSYSYFIRDDSNCISSVSNEIIINSVEDLVLTIDESAAVINCNGQSTALIEATASGGLGNYQYGLFGDSGLTNIIRPYSSSDTFADLPQGTYFVSVQSEDCQTTSMAIVIDEPTPLVVNPTITDISCNGAEDGSIVLDVSGGTADYQYAISPNLNQFDDSNIFTGLSAGMYDVIVQDSEGCFELIEFEITEPTTLEMEYTSTPEICAGDEDGTIQVTITGGTAPYSTSLNSNSDSDFVEDRVDFDSLASGTYVVFVKDANGCITNQVVEIESGANINATAEVLYECSGDTPENILVISLEDPTVTSEVLYALDSGDPADMVLEPSFNNMTPGEHFVTIAHANGCINTVTFEVQEFMPLQLVLEQRNINEITALASGGRQNYTYYFNDVDNSDDNTFYITETNTYTVRVVDENGCESVAEIFMEFIDIEIPTFFTPDGDSLNDYWLPRNIEQFPNIFINIFDRYGRKVYKLEDNEEGWSGLYNDTDMPTGDYWYIIKLNGEEDTREFIGHFTLYR
ncbi:T9SS type B sorting domain-containing protein [uncultured Croceitalea sp.]|uniref:T9SS type B sorting domain-containing protein n=1 Tax=uncultured Croceitalea sp. TaxID=1798908 RepID=UPI00330564F9